MPIVIAFILIGEPVLSILYGNSLTNSEVTLATQMLLVMSVSVIFGSLLQTQNNMLQGLGYGKITAYNMAISAGVQVILFISLSITDLNIWGCVIASMVFYIMAYFLNYMVIRRKLQLKILPQSVVPALGGGVLLLLYIMNIGLLNLGNIFTVLLSVVGGGLVYLFGVWVWGGLDEIFAHKKIKKSV